MVPGVCAESRTHPAPNKGLDLTADVKGWEQLFYVRSRVFFLWSIGRAGASKTRRLITLLSVGWVPPSVRPSGACLILGTSRPVGLITPPRVPPPRGGASAERRWDPLKLLSIHRALYAVGGTGICWAMAHMKPTSSRAMATTTCLPCLPVAISWRYRLQSRTWGCHLMA